MASHSQKPPGSDREGLPGFLWRLCFPDPIPGPVNVPGPASESWCPNRDRDRDEVPGAGRETGGLGSTFFSDFAQAEPCPLFAPGKATTRRGPKRSQDPRFQVLFTSSPSP